MTTPPKSKALERLRRALEAIPELQQQNYGSEKFNKWRRNTRIAIANTFEDKPGHITEFDNIHFFPFFGFDPSESERQKAYMEGLQSSASVLESMIEEVKEYWEDENSMPAPSEIHKNGQINTDEVFIIHGRDDGTKQAIARFLETLGLETVILHEQANLGRTIIEKFEEHAQVGFALAVLTPDDVGSLKGEESNLKARARQNVIFEFGFFIGRLGRRRVCALTKGDMEIPSDYKGVVYIPLDDTGAWKMSLIKELKAAGLDVDANLAL